MDTSIEMIEAEVWDYGREAQTALVTPIGPNQARIVDAMGCSEYHLGDIVDLIEPSVGGWLKLGRVVHREHESQVNIPITDESQYWRLKAIVGVLGGAIQRINETPYRTATAVTIACSARIDIPKLVKAIGMQTFS